MDHGSATGGEGGEQVDSAGSGSRSSGWRDPFGWIVVATALLVRVLLWLQWTNSPVHGHYVVDHGYYLDWARTIARGEVWAAETFEQAPGYAYLLAGYLATFGERFGLLLAVQQLVGATGCLLLYHGARRIVGRPAALVAGLLTATYGPLAFHELQVMKSFLSPFVTVVCFYALVRFGEKPSWIWLVTAGAAVAAGCLVRESHVLMFGAVLACVWAGPAAVGVPIVQRIRWTAVATTTLVVCLLPTTLRNAAVSGGAFVPVTTGGGEVCYLAHGPYADGYYRPPDFVDPHPLREHEDFRVEAMRRTGRFAMSRVEVSRYWYGEGWKAVVENPRRELWLVGRKLAILGHDFEVDDNANFTATRRLVPVLGWLPSFGLLFGLGLQGLFFPSGGWRRWQVVWLLTAAHVLTVLLTYNFGRFRLGMMPLWCLAAAVGLVVVVTRLRQRRTATAVVLVLVAATASAWSYRSPPGFASKQYVVDDAMFLGQMAIRAGDREEARRRFDEAVRLLAERTDESSQPDGNRVALQSWKAAEALRSAGWLDLAHRYYEEAVRRPNRPENRVYLVRHWLSVILVTERSEEGLPVRSDRLIRALEAWQHLRPDEVEPWALATPIATTAHERRRLALELERTFALAHSGESRAWYWSGRAVLADAAGRADQAADFAAKALRAVAEHPWRPRLERMTRAHGRADRSEAGSR